MAMTRARWGLAGALALAALVVGIKAFAAYVTAGSTVGVVAMLVLLAVMAIGIGSLARARWDLARELLALSASPPAGTLYGARRRQLEELVARQVTPDLDALAASAAAAENERGYAGRYLVATTVLVGLVGTFGGLMETLGRLPPLLSSEGTGTLALLAGPLAGLHVTFGTSLVAILITLALSLVQGDVTLNQERLLALLEERTRHVLMPVLWPTTETAADRTVREVAGLRSELAQSFTAAAAASATELAKIARGEIQRLVTEVGVELRASAAAQTKAVEGAARAMAGAMETATRALTEDARANRAKLDELGKQVAGDVSTSLRESGKAASALFERSAEGMKTAVAGVTASFEQSAGRLTETVGVATTVLTETSREAAADLRATLGRTHEGILAELRATAQGSAEALTTGVREARDALVASALESKTALMASATASKEALAAAAADSRDASTMAVLESTRALTDRAAETKEALVAAVSESMRALTAASAETKGALVSAASESARALTAASTESKDALISAVSESMRVMTAASTESKDGLLSAVSESTRALAAAAAESKTALATAAEDIGRSLATHGAEARAETERVARALEDLTVTSLAVTRDGVAELVAATRDGVGALVATTNAELARSIAGSLEQARVLQTASAEQLARVAEQVGGNAEAQVASARASATAIEQASAALLARFAEVGGNFSERLDAAAAALATAAGEVRGTLDTLSPTLGRLASELEGLMREVALLAARTDAQETPEAILDELSRLAEDVERLVALAAKPRTDDDLSLPVVTTDESPPLAAEEGEA